MTRIRDHIPNDQTGDFIVDASGILKYMDRACVPVDTETREHILRDAYYTPYTIYPSGTKVYKDLKAHFWWNGMKRNIGRFVAQCLTCQQIKAEHRVPAGKL